jgi:hypothetical protein
VAAKRQARKLLDFEAICGQIAAVKTAFCMIGCNITR